MPHIVLVAPIAIPARSDEHRASCGKYREICSKNILANCLIATILQSRHDNTRNKEAFWRILINCFTVREKMCRSINMRPSMRPNMQFCDAPGRRYHSCSYKTWFRVTREEGHAILH